MTTPAASETAGTPGSLGSVRIAPLLFLFFASGAAALIYEVLWLKELGRLFGVTSYAAATTLAVFFMGLAAGGFVWGRRVGRIRNPLRTYALLELGIAASALLYFGLLDLYHWINAPLFSAVGYRPALALVIKFVLAAGILFPPAFFMGGTLPVMAQFLIRRADQLGRRASLLYALNTIGATVGAFLAGFVLPRYLGFRNSYLVAIGLNLLIAAITYLWSTRVSARSPDGTLAAAPPDPSSGGGELSPPTPIDVRLIWSVAALSGFLTLALEVLWTRMFAQVLQNSVYTFSTILTLFLAALALGSGLANRLCQRPWNPQVTLVVLLTLAGFLVGLTPLVFYEMNANLRFGGGNLGWNAYIVSVFIRTGAVLLVPTVVMGAVFPFLMKLSETNMRSAGKTIGELAAVNTSAAILGSLMAGFLLLELFGVWGSIRLMAIGYLVLALVSVPRRLPWRGIARAVPALGILLFAVVLTYGDFARVALDPRHGEELVEVWDGSHGTVAVVRRDQDLRIKVNNSYNLGTSTASLNQRLQSYLPLSLQPLPQSVFYLGMGTGITAGGALDFPVRRVTVCELNEDVVKASRKYFRPWVNGLYEDPRARVLAEDGRTYLASSREQFDLIVADIFLTYKAGVGSLYTLEHFQTVRSRLGEGGTFVQWLPMFDLSVPEFGIVARTMLEVFDDVTLWRRSLSPSYPVYALMGRAEPQPLDLERLNARFAELAQQGNLPERVWLSAVPLMAYAGNLRQAEALFARYPVGTDDRTPLEYLSPITERNNRSAGKTDVLAWIPLADFCQTILEAAPPRRDPYLEGISELEIDQVWAGLAYYRYEVYRRLERPLEAEAHLREHQRLLRLDPPTSP